MPSIVSTFHWKEPFFAPHVTSESAEVCLCRRHAMRTVKFAPKVRKLATRVLQHLQKDAHNFNGLHLRLESDYESLLLAHGPRGFDNEAASYLRALKQHGCDSKTLLYIGSGVFSEAERRAGNELNKKVCPLQLARDVF